MKAMIFVDYWNLVLGFNRLMTGDARNKTHRIPWDRVFPEAILKQIDSSAEYS